MEASVDRALNPLKVSVWTLGGFPPGLGWNKQQQPRSTVRLARDSTRCWTAADHVVCQSDPSHVVRPL